MHVAITPHFRHQFKKLEKVLQEEIFERIELFKAHPDHSFLKVHKLKGEFVGRWSFSVNYKYRVIFVWEKHNESAILLTVGDHSVYD